MAGGKVWSKDEVSILETYYDSSKESLCALLPDRKWRAITLKAYKIGLRRPTHGFQRGHTPVNSWPLGEVELLRKSYPTLPPSQLYGLFPDKTPRAIKLKANRLGLKRPSKRFAETREKCSNWQRGRQLSPEHKANVTNGVRRNPPWLGKHLPQEVRDLLSWLAKERLLNPQYRRKILSSRRPTDIEQVVIDVVEKYSLPYRYTGDGSFLIGRFNPDFVNTNDRKIAVDIFGDRWHDLKEIPLRKAAFAEYGWELVILWGHEVKSMTELEIAKRLPK